MRIKNYFKQIIHISRGKVLRNIIWLFIDNVLRMGAGLIIGIYLARHLGPSDFGLFSFSLAFTSVFGVVATLGIKDIIVRDLVHNPKHSSTTIGSAITLQAISGIISFVLIVIFINLIRSDDDLAKVIVYIMGLTVIFKFGEVASYWFESQIKSRYRVIVQNVIFLFFSIIKAVMIYYKSSITMFAWVTFLEVFVYSISIFVVMNVYGPKLQELSFFNKDVLKKLLKDSWPLTFSAIAVTIYMKIDQIMLGAIFGNSEVGIYSVAVKISEVWYFVPMAIIASISPIILEAKKKDAEKYIFLLKKIFELLVLISLIVAIPMTFFADFIVVFLFGNQYEAAGVVLMIHIWASVFVFLGVASQNWFLAENKQIMSLQRTLIGAFIKISLNIILVPILGLIGCALATVITQIAAAFLFDFIQESTRPLFYMKLNAMYPKNFLYSLTYFKNFKNNIDV